MLDFTRKDRWQHKAQLYNLFARVASATVPIGPVSIAYPGGTRFDRAQLIALAMIRDSFHERPIYFASQAGVMSGSSPNVN